MNNAIGRIIDSKNHVSQKEIGEELSHMGINVTINNFKSHKENAIHQKAPHESTH